MSVSSQPPLSGFPTPRELRGLDHAPAGAERLLAELAARGLRDEHLPRAAALVLELEIGASEGEAT